MGDVAMLVPVVHSLAVQYPQLHVTFLTRKHLVPLYDWMPSNVEIIGVDLKDEYKGFGGLNRLYSSLRNRHFDAVADMHDVLRSKYLRWRFRLAGTKCAHINKGRKEKKQLIGKGTASVALQPMAGRYSDVLKDLGIPIQLDYKGAFEKDEEDLSTIVNLFGEKEAGTKWIGIAPFAAHENKIYTLDKMHEVVLTLAAAGYLVFLFGAGKKEKEILDSWADRNNIISICGKLGGLHNEMLLMSQLDVMVAMDSANMHIASIVGVPVISIWGATHPKAGFLPWNQSSDNFIQVDDLQCRPCSVYGNKPCQFGDQRCMNKISPQNIIDKIRTAISR